MKKLFLSLLIFSTLSILAQDKQRQTDWQQKVDYVIDVQLDDEKHQLKGNISITYTNNSPTALEQIYMHLWPNAYKDNSTAFAVQQLENGKTEFQFADEDERGWIDQLSFKALNKELKWTYFEGNKDIALINLASPLKTGETVVIATPFRVQIPGSFSRFGHVDEDYQITQWYPKPAVFDVNGWNPMPYLDQGEFYSEFGTFEVSITVPDNYIVAATGVMQNEEEWKRIDKRVNNPINPEEEVASSKTLKTLKFTQSNIHDFAWFASKYFNIERNEVKIDGRTIKAYGYAPKTDFEYSADIVKTLKYYSEHVGPYPYDYCSVVFGPLKAGGGMEYPMITVISTDIDEVVIHEVGHNWFYGFLANNERRYPWMDESLNTYYEGRTVNDKRGVDKAVDLEGDRFVEYINGANDKAMEVMSIFAEKRELHQAVGMHSADFTEMNYGTMVYGKGSLIFNQLEAHLGQAMIDSCFKAYYNKWIYKHPLPGDVKDIFEQTSGQNLSWFFDDMINTESHLNYSAGQFTPSGVTVINNGGIAAPFSLGLFKEGKMIYEVQVDGFKDSVEIKLPQIEYELVKLDPRENLRESNRKDNTLKKKGLSGRMEPLDFQFLTALENPNRTQIFWLPIMGYNIHDKFMLGVYLGNKTIEGGPFSFRATPLYSFENQTLNGFLDAKYHFYRKAKLNDITVGYNTSSFTYEPNFRYRYNQNRLQFDLNFRPVQLRNPRRSRLSLSLQQVTHYNSDIENLIDEVQADTTGRRSYLEDLADYFFQIEYAYNSNKTLDPMGFKMKLEYGIHFDEVVRNAMDADNPDFLRGLDESGDFLKADLELTKRISYGMKKAGLNLRAYGGFFLIEDNKGLMSTGKYDYRIGTDRTRYDYTFDQVLMGRGANDGVFARQVLRDGAGLKINGNLGNISSWLVAFNIESGFPWGGPVNVYADIFSTSTMTGSGSAALNSTPYAYSAGFAVNVIPSILSIYVPLVNSTYITDIQELQGIDKFAERITFTLNLRALNLDSIDELLR